MRVVLIGGTGNISRGVTKALLGFGHEVTFFNRGITNAPIPAGVRSIRGDRHDYAAFEQRMRDERFEAAIDMICYTREEAESDVRAFSDVKHFIHTSTVAVFGGKLAETPTDEESPRNPVIPYGANKVATDTVFREARLRDGFPVTVFMPAQTWGYQSGLVRQLAFGAGWLDRVRRGLPILETHDGQLIWSELHADDAGVAYGAALGRERCIGQTYILTRPGLANWREYHDQVGDALGKPIRRVDAPMEWLIREWPSGTNLLASEARWNRIYCLDRITRDIPEFSPTITLADRVGELVADLDRRGLIPDSRSDDTEDRLIARVESL